METTSQHETSTLTEVTTSTLSSTTTGHTLTHTVSQRTSSPDGTTTPPDSSVSSTPPPTSEVLISTPSTDSTQGNTGNTISMITERSTLFTTGVPIPASPNELSTVTTPRTSTQESSTVPQNQHTENIQTTSSPQSSTPTEATTSTLSSSSNRPTLAQTVSQETSSPGEITTSTPSVSSTLTTTSEVHLTSLSTDSSPGDFGHTSPLVTQSLTPITSTVSMTTVPRQSTVLLASTSTQQSITFSQSQRTANTEISSNAQTSMLTEVTTASHSSAPIGPTLTKTFSHGTSSPGMITSSLKTDSWRNTTSLSTTSLTLTSSSTPRGSSSTASPLPILPGQGIPLFPYGSSPAVRDLQLFARAVDFTSPLFKIQIGFPLGSSLRDSFYFTDNGQIIFPESDYHIFSYPNPPLRGFTGWDRVAMVAPFWDDADFSSYRGTIFYQEYETLYGESSPLIREVETLINKFTDDWSYKAKWTLKVTWVNVPAYPAQWNFGTNTYQAILSTDGSKSYALFLYQSGGMRWDVTQSPRNSVLMGFSSGDGYFENSPLTYRPAMEKYHPDQFLNSKLGIRGLQIYKLHREERPNYRLKCLWWLNSQPQWPQWSQISCPCSWQQGRWDLRFQPVYTGWWDRRSRQLCSFSSQQRGVCCSYGRWGEFREGWSVESPWLFDQKLEVQNWCCHWNDKPHFCVLYQLRHPPVSCAGYRPPRLAWAFGDPHIITLDNVSYTFNGLGDFLLVQARDRNSSFQLQGRTAQTGSASATNFIAFAAQYNTSSLGSITVQWHLEANDTIHVLHNNQTVSFNASHTDAEGLEIFNTTGILLTRNGSEVSANFDGTVTISVIALSNILHASSGLPEEYWTHTEGLLGVWNGNPEDDFRMPNGTTIPGNSSEEELFHYGMTWHINGTGLLGTRTDNLPPNFIPDFFSQLLEKNDLDTHHKLTSVCNGGLQCIQDALATGNVNIGLITGKISQRYQEMNATLNRNPPSVNCCSEIQAYKGQTQRIQVTSDSENVTFTLSNHCTDFVLLENGSLLWTPTVPEPCTLEIVASHAMDGLFSIVQPKTVACFCRHQSQCLYNETRRAGNSSLELTSCKCDGDTFGQYCEHSKNLCEEQCFPNVPCIPGKGCEACPPNMTGDGRHCAALEDSLLCQNHSCPVNYCYNGGHCYISGAPDCQPTCTCPPAFTDARCLLAGNNFTPTILREIPLRTIRLSLRENRNASKADVNASVAYRLGTLAVRAFLRNSMVGLIRISPPALGSKISIQHWTVISHFQYRPAGPVIHFLNNQLLDAVVEAFLLQAPRETQTSIQGKNNVAFFPISRADVHNEMALNLSTLETYFTCDGYQGYHLVYSPQNGLTCVSPCREGYCQNGAQCQHLPDGPRCSCVSFTIYVSWGEHCEHLSVKLGAFFGILFGALGALLLLVASVVFCFWGYLANRSSYPLTSEF
ncbi:mucin-4 [Nannospalax galili]|uniref:mucin-4 n=1 Tax=Nannospalax galili TaxID=1026970 RepID=UPI000819C890|nr:mucin-4 [Nannospalax galili]